jgi:hypothetical protein
MTQLGGRGEVEIERKYDEGEKREWRTILERSKRKRHRENTR